jgi:hypothetical protein
MKYKDKHYIFITLINFLIEFLNNKIEKGTGQDFILLI